MVLTKVSPSFRCNANRGGGIDMDDKNLCKKRPDSSDQSNVSKTRRKLLLTGSALACGAAITSIPGCGGGSSGSGGGQETTTDPGSTTAPTAAEPTPTPAPTPAPASPTPPPPPAPTSFSASSAGDGSGHLHTFTIQCTDLSGGGKTYIGGPPSDHSHPVTLSAAQLTTLANGGTVTINTTDGHPHTWIITKPSDACT